MTSSFIALLFSLSFFVFHAGQIQILEKMTLIAWHISMNVGSFHTIKQPQLFTSNPLVFHLPVYVWLLTASCDRKLISFYKTITTLIKKRFETDSVLDLLKFSWPPTINQKIQMIISTRYSLTTDFSPWLSYQICHTQSFGWDLKN